MKIIEDILLTEENFKDTYVAIGAFDGIHIGHKELILKAVNSAKKNSGKSVVFTFLNHPTEIIEGKKIPCLINSLEEKFYLLELLEVDYLILQPFTKEFSDKTANEFVSEILKDKLDAKEVFVGFNFSFGKGAKGKVKDLEELSNQNNIKANILSPVKIGDKIVSSTYIRELLVSGNLELANQFLGHNFLIIGEVIHGRKKGRTMGFPTANLKILNKMYPSFGIYGGTVKIEGEDKVWDAVINIGRNPTLKPGEESIEVHLLDFDKDIYGKKIYVSLEEFLRKEQKFNSIEELKETITKDVLNWKNKIKGKKNATSIEN